MSDTTNPVPTANRLVGYFSAEASAVRNFSVAQIPADQLTHVVYAFAGISAKGECIPADTKNDKVNLAQFLQLRQSQPKLLTLISVGGATGSKHFSKATATAPARKKLARSCMHFMKEHGFDGIDLAWEFPAAKDSRKFAALLAELRLQLNAQGKADKRSYLLTITTSANPHDYAHLELPVIHPHVDWINLMAYDFTTASSPTTDFNAPLFPPSDDPSPSATRLTHNVDATVKAYLEADVPANKLVVGVHLAGTGWQGVPNANSGLYQTNAGPAKGTWDAANVASTGVIGFQDIETNYLPTYTRNWHGGDDKEADAQVPWLYNPTSGIMISYEDAQSLAAKADYVLRNQLGGIMLWDLSADDAQHTLVSAFTGSIVPKPPFVHLAGVNIADTVLNNLKAGAPAQAFVNTTLNTALQSGLAGAATNANQPLLATLLQAMPAVDIAAQNNVTVQAFVSKNVTLPTNAADKKTAQAAIATLSTKTTIGTLLGLNSAVKDNPVFSAEVQRVNLANLLATAPSLAAQPQVIDDFVQRYAASTTSIEDFWSSLSKDANFKSLVPDMQLTLQLDRLTLDNVPLVQALQNYRQQSGGFKSLQDLLKVDATTWTNLITTPVNGQAVPIPAGITGTTPQEQATNYAVTMMSGLKLMFPSAALAQSLAAQPTITPSLVSQVLQANPNLDLSKDLPLNLNLSGIAAADQSAALASLRALQQEVRIFPGFDYKSALNALPVPNGGASGAVLNPLRANVAMFLANSPDFDFQTTNIDNYVAANPNALKGVSTEAQAPTVAQLKATQRIYRLAPDYETLSAVMGQGFQSSHSISSIPQNLFVRQYSGLLGGTERALKFHKKAQHISAQVTSVYVAKREELYGVNFGILKPSFNKWINPANIPNGTQPPPPPVLPSGGPDWQTLFGSTSSCQCTECRAIDGPAAYFVDLLQFLEKGTPNVSGAQVQNQYSYTPLDVLIGYKNNALNPTTPPTTPPTISPPTGRRPDLAYLKLNCVNTNTELPYIDLVNEILESYVFYSGSLPASSNNTQLDATSDQLSVNPEYTIPQVYGPSGHLATAVYPFTLPFDRFLATDRSYLEFAGTSRYALMKTFQTAGPTPTPTNLQIAQEYLKISPAEYQILTKPPQSIGDLAQYYGYGNSTAAPINITSAVRAADNDSGSLGTVTITTNNTAHQLLVNQVITITNVSDKSFNGTFVITSVPTRYTFTFNQTGVSTNVSDGSGLVAAADWSIDIAAVSNFLQQTGISFDDLTSLLFTRFLNPDQSITLQGDPSDMCNISTMMITNLAPQQDPVTLQKIYRFIRLYTKLGWQIPDLDKALSTLQSADIDANFISIASNIQQLLTALELPMNQLLALWANIDIDGRSSLYNSLFQNKAVINPIDLAFALDCVTSLSALPHAVANLSLTQDQFLSLFPGLLSYDASQNPPVLMLNGDISSEAPLLLLLSSDANYITAINSLITNGSQPAALKYWPTDLHLPIARSISTTLMQTPYFDAKNNTLHFTGRMTDEIKSALLDDLALKALNSADPNDSNYANTVTQLNAFILAVQNLYNQRWNSFTDIAIPSGQTSQPLISDHINTILAGIQISAEDLDAIGIDTNFATSAGLITATSSGNLNPPPTWSIPVPAKSAIVNIETTGTALPNSTAITIGGTLKPNDTITLGVTSAGINKGSIVSISYTVTNGDTFASVAASLSAMINSNQLMQKNVSAVAGSSVIWNSTTCLTLKNLSTIYRYAVLSKALDISVEDLISIKTLSGLDPFQAPTVQKTTIDPVQATGDALQFVQTVKTVLASKFSPAQLNYLYRALPDDADSLPPTQTDQEQLLVNLSTGLQKIANANAYTPDPTGATLRKKLGALLDSTQVGPTMALIDGTAIYTSPLPTVPSGATPPVGQVSFVTTATIGGTATPGDTVSLAVNLDNNTTTLSYQVGDTLNSIAANLAALINANVTLKAAGIGATVSPGAGVTVQQPANPAVVWTPSATNPSAVATENVIGGGSGATISLALTGQATPGDVITLAISLAGANAFSVTLAYTVIADTTTSIATELTTMIRNNTALTGFVATSAGSVIRIVSPPATTPYPVWTCTCSNSATETVSIANSLECIGPITAQTIASLTDLTLKAAVTDLNSQAQAILKNNLSFVADASNQLVNVDPSSTAASRMNLVLESLLNYIAITQSQSLVKQSLAQSLGLDATLVALLLQNNLSNKTSPLLLSQSLPKNPTDAITDFLGGLLAIYLDQTNTIPTMQIDPGVNLDGSEKTAFTSAQWFGQLVAPSSDSFTFYVPVNVGQVQLWVGDQLLIDTINPPDPARATTIALQAGKLYDLQLNYVNAPNAAAQIQLQWSKGSMSQQTIPASAFVLGADPSSAQKGNTLTFVQGGVYNTLSQLYRTALLVKGFSMQTRDVAYLSAHSSDFSNFELSRLPLDDSPILQSTIDAKANQFFTQWMQLHNLYQLKTSMPSGGNVGIFDIFATAAASNSSSTLTSPVINAILEATGWNQTDFNTLAGASGFGLHDADFTSESSLIQVSACLALGNQLGVSAKQLWQWANNPPDDSQAQDIQNTIKAKYDDATWLQVGKPLNDKVRESSKEALIAYILTLNNIQQNGITDADGLYEYFLIDVQMNPCMLTSRIVQATAAVQLFIERCLMNLENGLINPACNVAPCQIDGTEWNSWRKNYRVWQANRDVFLFAYKYCDPTLRDNKTPFFKDLENDLLQGEINAANVEQAYLNYLQKLDEVARLEMAGFCQNPSPDGNSNTVHVFGRTAASPNVYYYRSLSQNRADATSPWINLWSPWEKVHVDIQGNQLIPAMWNNRLYIYWPIFTESADPSSNQSTTNQTKSGGAPTKSLKIQMAWSEYKNGKWTKKQSSSSALVPQQFTNYQYGSPAFPYWKLFYPVPILLASSGIKFTVWSGFMDYFFFASAVDSFGNLVITAYVSFQKTTIAAAFVEIVGTFIFNGYTDSTTNAFPSSQPQVGFWPDYEYATGDLPKNMTFNCAGSLALMQTSSGHLPVLGPTQGQPESLWSSNDSTFYPLFPYWLRFSPQAIPSLFPVTSKSIATWETPFIFWDSERTYFVANASTSISDSSSASPVSIAKVFNPPKDAPFYFSQVYDINPNISAISASDNIPSASPANQNRPVPRGLVGNLKSSDAFNNTNRLGNITKAGVQFYTLYHPHVRAFIKALNISGLDNMLKLPNQELSDMELHLYTNSQTTFQTIIQNSNHDDGIAFFLYSPKSVQPSGTVPLYQLALTSFFTISNTESGPFQPSPARSVAGYVYDSKLSPPTGTLPLYRLIKGFSIFNTIFPFERDNAINWYGYELDSTIPDGIVCYVIDPDSVQSNSPDAIPMYQASAQDFALFYLPDPTNVVKPYPKADVDFSPGGAYSLYNWELFFHIPFLIATKLSQNNKFEEAEWWLKRIVDFTSDAGGPSPGRFWNFRPFNQASQPGRLDDMLKNLEQDAHSQDYLDWDNQVIAYEENPFDPHAIARLRPSEYQKAVVIKYLDILVARGDYLYGQNTRESIAEATQFYVRAKHILGPKPVTIPQTGETQDLTYRQMQQWNLDPLSNVTVPVENLFPFSSGNGSSNAASTGAPINNGSVSNAFYFCIPQDDTLLGYWDTIEDRLYKIRHCMNMQGQVEQLALFAPRINPALLVAAEAAGVDLSSVLNDINGAVPHYRFTYTLQKALELCAEVRSLGGALLSALEKKDTEALANLRATQELNLLNAVMQIKQFQLQEANTNVQALIATQSVTTARQNYYKGLVSEGVSQYETGQVIALAESQMYKTLGQAVQAIAPAAHLVPVMLVGDAGISGPVAIAEYGGKNFGDSASAAAGAFGIFADIFSFLATMASLTGQWDRRSQEWNFQLETVTLELAQITQQISAANLRVQIAQQDSTNQQLQIDNASAIMDFLQNQKFTNEDLYSWMIDQVSGIYFQCYQIAYDLAKRAEACFRYERGLAESNYIQFGYWDSLKQGLLCGEKLYMDLKRLDSAYMDQNKREYEITKSISILLLDPMALITLKETGQCIVTLPEAFFDMDYPGHYMRRIKSLSLTIPCVTGPFTSVNCTLTLVQSKIRWDSNSAAAYLEKPVASDPRFYYNFAAAQSVATSTAQNDSGMFEVNFHDERYLPFEGAGVISQWLISMPKNCNAFDFETISDLIINLRYTARPGGAALAQNASLAAVMPAPLAQPAASGTPITFPSKQSNLVRFFSLKHEFPTEWYQFLHPTTAITPPTQTMNLPITNERFPFQYRGKRILISQVQLFLKFKAVYPPSIQSNSTPLADYGTGALQIDVTPPGRPGLSTPQPKLSSQQGIAGGVPYAKIPMQTPAPTSSVSEGKLTPWMLKIVLASISNLNTNLLTSDASGNFYLNPEVVDDIFFVCMFSAQ